MAKEQEIDTEIRERLAMLEGKFNGGPGQSAICKLHQEAIAEVKLLLACVEKKLDNVALRQSYLFGGIAVITILVPLFNAFIMHLFTRKP